MSGQNRDLAVGIVGLGAMGGGMAANLLKAGIPLVAFDINVERNEHFRALGAQIGTSPAEVARMAKIVITMVDTTDQSREVILGPNGIVQGAEPGDAVICMSTIDPLAVQSMERILAGKGVGIIDAPVSGMIKGANEGTLRAFVGGDAAVLEQCRYALDPMTSEIIHVGALGQGLVMKLINNMIYKINSVAAIEGMVLAAKAGLEPKMVRDVIGRSTGDSVAFQYRAQRIIDRNFEGVRMDISCKDLELETALGRALHVPLFLASVTTQIYEMGRAAGLGGRDATALVTIYEDLTGQRVGGDPDQS